MLLRITFSLFIYSFSIIIIYYAQFNFGCFSILSTTW